MSPAPVLETERLWLRQMRPSDEGALLGVLGDAEGMRHYPAPFTACRVRGWIEWQLQNYTVHGYGLWALVQKSDRQVIGDCGLTWQRVGYSAERHLEAGWHVRRDLWNKGLATEAGLACRDYARDVIGARHLIAIIAEANLASQTVARKLGMELERRDVLDGHERLIFGMDLAPR